MIRDRDQQELDGKILAQRIEHFRRRWQPNESGEDAEYQKRDFEVELHALVQSIFRVAQEPLLKHMSAALALVPPSPIFIETPKKQ